jgi:hypothetical protein
VYCANYTHAHFPEGAEKSFKFGMMEIRPQSKIGQGVYELEIWQHICRYQEIPTMIFKELFAYNAPLHTSCSETKQENMTQPSFLSRFVVIYINNPTLTDVIFD